MRTCDSPTASTASSHCLNRQSPLSAKRFGKDYSKTRDAFSKLSKLKQSEGSKKFILYNCLVFDGGRYRAPGSKYTTLEKSVRGSTNSVHSRSSSKSRLLLNHTADPKNNRRPSISSFRSSKKSLKPESRKQLRAKASPNLKPSFGVIQEHKANPLRFKTSARDEKTTKPTHKVPSVTTSKKPLTGQSLTEHSHTSKEEFPKIRRKLMPMPAITRTIDKRDVHSKSRSLSRTAGPVEHPFSNSDTRDLRNISINSNSVRLKRV